MFLTNQNLNVKIFHFKDFVKELHILCICFVTFVVLIWCYLGECSFPIYFYLWFFFFCIEFVNVKVGWMLVENNGVSMMDGNCKKSHMNIILSPPNGNMLDFNFYNFKCIVVNIVQPTIDISSTIINWMSNQLSSIVLDLFIIVFLSIDKPNTEWIVVPLINKTSIAMYVAMFYHTSLHHQSPFGHLDLSSALWWF